MIKILFKIKRVEKRNRDNGEWGSLDFEIKLSNYNKKLKIISTYNYIATRRLDFIFNVLAYDGFNN